MISEVCLGILACAGAGCRLSFPPKVPAGYTMTPSILTRAAPVIKPMLVTSLGIHGSRGRTMYPPWAASHSAPSRYDTRHSALMNKCRLVKWGWGCLQAARLV